MNNVEFVFNGGLGNQIFQYIASREISNKFKNIDLNYSLSNYIISGARNFDLNQLLIKPVKVDDKHSKFNDEFIAKHLTELLCSKKFAKNFDEDYELIKRYLIADIPVDKHKDSLNELEKTVHALKKHSASKSLKYGKGAEITYAELVDNISPLLFSYIN